MSSKRDVVELSGLDGDGVVVGQSSSSSSKHDEESNSKSSSPKVSFMESLRLAILSGFLWLFQYSEDTISFYREDSVRFRKEVSVYYDRDMVIEVVMVAMEMGK